MKQQNKDEKFIKDFEEKVKSTIKKYNLFNKKDRISVAASGGKDSTILLYLMKKLGYDVSALTVNSHIGCYSDENLSKLNSFCSEYSIPLKIISLRKEFGHSLCSMISMLKEKKIKKTSCSVCGALRRYLLNKYSKNADVLVTGHNLDDEFSGMLTAMCMGNVKQMIRSGPLISVKGFVKKAKPFYFVFEDEIVKYSKIMKFDVSYSWCPCSEGASRRFYSELDINDEKKMNFVNNVLSALPNLKLQNKKTMKKCSLCKGPSSNETCQTCMILKTVKS